MGCYLNDTSMVATEITYVYGALNIFYNVVCWK